MKKGRKRNEEVAEDYCFVCKDGGLLIVCEHSHCNKAYHHECVGIDSTDPQTNDQWTCSWHSCFICHTSSKFRCFGCPNSVCQACTKVAEFVLVRGEMGFCNDCLKLVLMIEENVDVDSDGEEVDFKDRETYECLFEEYWNIIKQGLNISLEDLHTADKILKKGGSIAYRPLATATDDKEYKSSDDAPVFQESKGQHVWMKLARELYRPRKNEIIGWGSKRLMNFLTEIGRSVEEPISQLEVSNIIMEYIQENELIHPERKRKVMCDARLHSLFCRKSVNSFKIFDLLDGHFSESQVSEDEESQYKSEDENVLVFCKRQRLSSADSKTSTVAPDDSKKNIFKVPIICYASITSKNIKLAYLRRSLIEEFLKNPETFESKVMDSFVRVKCDPKDNFSARSCFQLVQVTGVRSSEAYKIGDIITNAVLCVSHVVKDIGIDMVSDGDFSEEECEDLRQRMKTGLLKRPTLAELEKKARSLHEDITNHWIDREIGMLQNMIDRANEKGWRREHVLKLQEQILKFAHFSDCNKLFQYIERRQLLQTPSERLRLLNELPRVIADAEVDLEAKLDSPKEDNIPNEGIEVVYHQKTQTRGSKGKEAALDQMCEKEDIEGNGDIMPQEAGKKGAEDSENVVIDVEENETTIPKRAIEDIEVESREKDVDVNDVGGLDKVTREVNLGIPIISLEENSRHD